MISPAAGTRTLLVNKDEAATVRHIFGRYLELGSVHVLQRELESAGIDSKLRTYATGRTSGGQPFSRGALFHLLRNKIYLGQVVHKDQVFDGAHDGIVEPELFAQVQARLDAQARRHRSTAEKRTIKAPLTGKLFDAAGAPMSPTTSRGKSGRSYRYYVSAPLQQGAKSSDPNRVERLAAPTIEQIITDAMGRWLPGAQYPFEIVRSVHLSDRGLQVTLDAAQASSSLAARLAEGEVILDRSPQSVSILLPIRFSVNGGRRVIAAASPLPPQPDPVLIAALRKAHSMLRTERGLPVIETAPASPYERSILRLAFLAPDIQRAILDGRQPRRLNLEALKQIDIPLAWSNQRQVLGFGSAVAPCSAD
jgi:site-specific DNA recombinase